MQSFPPTLGFAGMCPYSSQVSKEGRVTPPAALSGPTPHPLCPFKQQCWRWTPQLWGFLSNMTQLGIYTKRRKPRPIPRTLGH